MVVVEAVVVEVAAAEVSGEGGGEGRMEAMASMILRRNCCDALSYRSKAIWNAVTTLFARSWRESWWDYVIGYLENVW